VQSIDKAGFGSPVFTTDPFLVTWDGYEKDRWRLDARSGTTAVDQPSNATAPITANALTLSGTASFLPAGSGGVWYLDDPAQPNLQSDGALHVNGAAGIGQAASTATKLVDVRNNWSVSAWVRPENTTTRRVAVSQDDATDSGFAVGITPVKVPQDDGTTVTQQRFFLAVDNPTAGAADVEVIADNVNVEPGEWYSLTAIYDHETRTASLVVLDLYGLTSVSAEQLAWEPSATMGALRLGSARVASAAKYAWAGDIDEVANLSGALSTDLWGDGRLVNYVFQGR